MAKILVLRNLRPLQKKLNPIRIDGVILGEIVERLRVTPVSWERRNPVCRRTQAPYHYFLILWREPLIVVPYMPPDRFRPIDILGGFCTSDKNPASFK
jgi:hypothetical protein